MLCAIQPVSIEQQPKDTSSTSSILDQVEITESDYTEDQLRLCVDYRQFDNLTIKDSYALPTIEDLFVSLAGSTCADMNSGYHQVEILEEHKEKTAFTVGPLGFFEYNRMPFRLTNLPATYPRMMEEYLSD